MGLCNMLKFTNLQQQITQYIIISQIFKNNLKILHLICHKTLVKTKGQHIDVVHK